MSPPPQRQLRARILTALRSLRGVQQTRAPEIDHERALAEHRRALADIQARFQEIAAKARHLDAAERPPAPNATADERRGQDGEGRRE